MQSVVKFHEKLSSINFIKFLRHLLLTVGQAQHQYTHHTRPCLCISFRDGYLIALTKTVNLIGQAFWCEIFNYSYVEL